MIESLFLFKIGFLEVRFLDLLDILLVAVLMYQVFKLLRGSLAFNIFLGFLLVFLVFLLVDAFNMNLLSQILGQFIGVGMIALLIVFQPEIRRFLLYIGRSSGIGKQSFWQNLFNRRKESTPENSADEESFLKSLTNLANNKIGALIVFADGGMESFFGNTGVSMHADYSGKLIESIFQKTSPLHDGAVVISTGQITAAGCILPVSENPNLPSRIGLRHRAAVGITEQIDAMAVIVSEETGKISVAHKGVLNENAAPATLREAFRKGM